MSYANHLEPSRAASILEVCERRVNILVSHADLDRCGISRDALIERITAIVSHNLVSQRMQRVIKAQGQDSAGQVEEGACAASHSIDQSIEVARYVDRVIKCYLQEYDRVERLAAQQETAWMQLFEQLAARAHNMLLRMQVPAAQAASEAADFAQESCEAIHIHPFPYDVAFDAWTARILKNNVLQRYTRSRDVTDRMPGTVSLDGSATIDREDTFSLYSLLSDESSTSAFDRADVREWLLGAIAKLKSQAQQQVILDTYFYELDDGEIARRLGKTKNAVYILRYRALQNLKQMLSQAERKKRR